MLNAAMPAAVLQLLNAAKPYLWLFACFTLAPMPTLVFDAERAYRRVTHWLLLLYTCFALLMLCGTIWSAYLNSLVLYDITDMEHPLDSLTKVLNNTQNAFVVIVHAVILFNMFFKFQTLRRIYRTIEKLEMEIMAAHMQYTAASMPPHGIGWRHSSVWYADIRFRLAIRAGAFGIFLAIALPTICAPLSMESIWLPYRILTVYILFIVQFKTVEYCVVVLLVQELLRRLQLVLRRLKLELVNCEQLALRRALCLQLRINQHQLSRIWLLVTDVESYFMLPMLFLFLYDGLAITHIVNWAYIRSFSSHDNYQYYRLANVLVLIMNILIPCWLSQCCINTYNEFSSMLHKLKSDGSDILLTMRLREYSLQLMHQELLFTCGGFFDINLKYFGALILTITTYVVILIQFKLQDESETQQVQQII